MNFEYNTTIGSIRFSNVRAAKVANTAFTEEVEALWGIPSWRAKIASTS